MQAAIPVDEVQRVRDLRAYDVIDTPPERAFDDIARLAARLCGTPIALVSLVDATRQWFKARVGVDGTETPRNVSFCAHAILHPQDVLVVPDTRLDPRFADNPQVTGPPHYRFYAGAPIVTPAGHAMGTVCVLDHQPRTLSPEDREALQALAARVATELELRRTVRELEALVRPAEAAAPLVRTKAAAAPASARQEPAWGTHGAPDATTLVMGLDPEHGFAIAEPEAASRIAAIVTRLRILRSLAARDE